MSLAGVPTLTEFQSQKKLLKSPSHSSHCTADEKGSDAKSSAQGHKVTS